MINVFFRCVHIFSVRGSVGPSVRPSTRPSVPASVRPSVRQWVNFGRKWAEMTEQSKCSKLVWKSSKLSQNVLKCPKMSQHVHFRRIVVRTDLLFSCLDYFSILIQKTPQSCYAWVTYHDSICTNWSRLVDRLECKCRFWFLHNCQEKVGVWANCRFEVVWEYKENGKNNHGGR